MNPLIDREDLLPAWVRAAMKVERGPEKPLPEGPFTVWEDLGYEGWTFTDYPTLEAALHHQALTSRRVIQKPVSYKVTEQ